MLHFFAFSLVTIPSEHLLVPQALVSLIGFICKTETAKTTESDSSINFHKDKKYLPNFQNLSLGFALILNHFFILSKFLFLVVCMCMPMYRHMEVSSLWESLFFHYMGSRDEPKFSDWAAGTLNYGAISLPWKCTLLNSASDTKHDIFFS